MSQPLKILVIPSWYPPDGGYFFKEHNEALARGGCEVHVLVNRVIGIRRIGRLEKGNWFRPNSGYEDGLLVLRSIYWKIPGFERLNIKLWKRSTIRLFRKYLHINGRPDIILAHSAIWAGLAAAGINKEFNIPYIITEHRSFFVFDKGDARSKVKSYYIPHLHEAYNLCTKLIIVSESMKSGLLELFPELGIKIEVIPNMVNGDYFNLPGKARVKDPFIFLSAGRLAAVKGLDVLISAFAKLVEKTDKKVLLRIAGRGEMREQLEDKVRSSGLSENVNFLGRVSRENMVKEMQGANCFVLSSSYEAFGVVLIEAMSTGLPVIGTRSGGPESIIDEGCGYLVDPGETARLTEAMLMMINKYEKFNQELIRARVLQQYGSGIITEKYLEAFTHIG
jgi:glycosyltransferase involved in cell wall biosynthesis